MISIPSVKKKEEGRVEEENEPIDFGGLWGHWSHPFAGRKLK